MEAWVHGTSQMLENGVHSLPVGHLVWLLLTRRIRRTRRTRRTSTRTRTCTGTRTFTRTCTRTRTRPFALDSGFGFGFSCLARRNVRSDPPRPCTSTIKILDMIEDLGCEMDRV